MFKGDPSEGDMFYDVDGNTLLVIKIAEHDDPETPHELVGHVKWVQMICIDSGIENDYYYDTFANFRSGYYLAKVG
jgi:hypothetical protein